MSSSREPPWIEKIHARKSASPTTSNLHAGLKPQDLHYEAALDLKSKLPNQNCPGYIGLVRVPQFGLIQKVAVVGGPTDVLPTDA